MTSYLLDFKSNFRGSHHIPQKTCTCISALASCRQKKASCVPLSAHFMRGEDPKYKKIPLQAAASSPQGDRKSVIIYSSGTGNHKSIII